LWMCNGKFHGKMNLTEIICAFPSSSSSFCLVYNYSTSHLRPTDRTTPSPENLAAAAEFIPALCARSMPAKVSRSVVNSSSFHSEL